MQATTTNPTEADRIPNLVPLGTVVESTNPRFDRVSARQRFIAVVAVISLVLSLVAVFRLETVWLSA